MLDHLSRSTLAATIPPDSVAPAIVVVQADISEYTCDILVLKYAQGFYGADRAVAGLLARQASMTGFNRENFALQPGEHRCFPSHGAVGARSVLFVGVPSLDGFNYDQIREFATSAVRLASESALPGATIAMTIHGVGYGLNESEAFRAQLVGLRAAVGAADLRNRIEKIVIVELEPERAIRLRQYLDGAGALG
jgi:hypothetical protein